MIEPRKRGRPRKTDPPEYITSSNRDSENVLNGQGIASTDEDDDLKSMLKKKSQVSEANSFVHKIEEEALKEIEQTESQDAVNDIPEDRFNPLDEPVQERSYTGGINSNFAKNNAQDRIIEEPSYRGGNATALDVDKDLITPNNDVPDAAKAKVNQGNVQPESQSTQQNNDGTAKPADDAESENLKNLSAKEKRESIEKTADAILLAYRNYIPLPFIYFSEYDTKKLEQLHRNDELNLDTQVKRDGTLFREYVKEFNAQVGYAFTVTDAEVEALKDPLVDVLMEKEIALTPTQRLLFTVGQLMVAKVMLTVKFLREKKSDIAEMKQIHEEKMQVLRDQMDREERRAAGSAKPPNPVSEPAGRSEPLFKDEDKKEPATTISDAQIISEQPNSISLEDALNMADGDDDADIPD
jgi:hypothetical protein